MLRDLVRWDPFQEMAPIWPIDARNASFPVAFEVKETKDAFQFRADVPGVKEQDIDVTLTGRRLSVSGKRTGEGGKGATTTTCSAPREHTRLSHSLRASTPNTCRRARGVLSISPEDAAFQPKKIAVKATDKTVKI
jgi:HSP20 family protein